VAVDTYGIPRLDRQHEASLRRILDALPAAIYMTDATGRITYFNRAAAELAGREPEIGKDRWCVAFRLFTPDGKALPHDQCPMAVALKEDRPVRGVEALAQRPDGTMFPFLPFPSPLHDESGNLIGAVNMLVDISQRKQAETNQQRLLAELNHRVKNNMQMLYGLLHSAQRDSANQEAREVLADASQRVAAMAAAQQLLYREGHPDGFAIDEFLRSVCAGARHAFGGDEVDLHIEADAGRLCNDAALPLGLILNELVTNAFKHGLKNRKSGKVCVSLLHSQGDVVLTVQDDGPGFEWHDTGRRSSGLGLVRGLAGQLNGSLSIAAGRGTCCVVRFTQTPVQ
jgi:PAS domain S-box-containing protein